MNADKRSKLTKAVAAALFPLLVGMFGGHLLIQIVDRFKGNDSAWSFYMPSVDATCVVARRRGQEVMHCLPGNRAVSDSI